MQNCTHVPRKAQIVEVFIFLLLIVPSMIISLFVVRKGGASFSLAAYSTLARDTALVCLILYFLWRNGEPVSLVGWTSHRVWKEALVGVELFIPLLFATGLLEMGLKSLGLSSPSTPLPSFLTAKGASQFVLAFVLVVVVAVAEETIFRGYLILRLACAVKNPAAAAVISSIIFSVGHGYEGSAGVVTVGAMGLTFALVYMWRKSLVAPVVMHFCQDFLGIVLLPLIRAK